MNIAKLSIKLSADAAGLSSDLAKAGGNAVSWAAKAAQDVAASFGSIGSLLAAPLRGLSSAYSSFKGMADDLVAQDREARRLGVTMDEMRQATVWAGDATGSLGGMLAEAQGKLAQFHTGSVTAAQDLASLAKAAGGTGAGIAGGGFAGIVKALERIPDPIMRAAQAFRFLGAGASDVLDQLGKPGGFAASQDMAKRFGLGVGAGDMKMVREASDAMRTLDLLGKGFWNQVLLGIAPVVAEIAKLFDGVKVNLEWIQPAMLKVAKAAAMTGAFIYEAFSNRDLWQKTIAAIGTALGSLVGKIGDALVKMVGDVWDSLTDEDNFVAPSLLDGVFGIGKDMKREGPAAAAKKAIRDLDFSGFDEVGKAFADTGAAKNVEGFFNRIDKRIIGTTDNLTKMLPAIKLLGEQFKAMQGATVGPGQKFLGQMAAIAAMGKAGLLAGNDTGALGAFQAFDALKNAMGGMQYRQVGAAGFGTREAYSALAENEAMQKRADVQQQMKQFLEQANEQRKEQIRIGNIMMRAMEKMADAGMNVLEG